MPVRIARKSRVPFLHDRIIEDEAMLLLDEWRRRGEPLLEPPVPIDEILEIHLQLEFLISDLQNELDHPDVLGAIWFGDRRIKVDQSLDPAISPNRLGRYRFTLAHEVGHWRLHRRFLMSDPAARSLFEINSKPAFVCRSSENPPEEIQANAFAAHLLMPRRMVLDAWSSWRGNDDPVVIATLPVNDYHGDRKANEEMAMDRFCRPLADQFGVSAQAMRIRLQALDLLVKELEPRLF